MRIDVVGTRFGRLTVLSEYCKKDHTDENIYYCVCQCDCGSSPKEIRQTALTRKTKNTISCGCYKTERTALCNRRINVYNLSGEYGIGYTRNEHEFYFDLDDYEKIWRNSWSYSATRGVYARTHSKDTSSIVYIHHFICGYPPNGMVVDHKNRNKKDNRKENLRFATFSQNRINSKIGSKNKSGFIGVSWNKKRKKYLATLIINGKNIPLGGYENINDAVTVRLKSEKEVFGKFAPQIHLFEQYGIATC